MSNIIKLTINSNQLPETTQKLEKNNLDYTLGEKQSIYSIGLSVQEILVVDSPFSKEELNNLLIK